MKKIIVISGGGEGLGRALAKQLSKNNRVVILGRNEAKLKKTAKELRCDYFVCDVANYTMVEKTADKIIKKYRRVDVIINNAGVWVEGALETNSPENIKAVTASNTLGVIFLTKAFVPQFKKQKQGTILNIVSIAGLRPKPGRTVYNASKYAITGFTKSLEMELSPFNIRVAGVYPGKIKTNLFKNAKVKKSMQGALDPIEVAKAAEFIINSKQSTLISHLEIRDLLYG